MSFKYSWHQQCIAISTFSAFWTNCRDQGLPHAKEIQFHFHLITVHFFRIFVAFSILQFNGCELHRWEEFSRKFHFFFILFSCKAMRTECMLSVCGFPSEWREIKRFFRVFRMNFIWKKGSSYWTTSLPFERTRKRSQKNFRLSKWWPQNGYMKRAKVLFSRLTTCLGLMTFTRRRNVCPRECEKKRATRKQGKAISRMRNGVWVGENSCLSGSYPFFVCGFSFSLFYLIIFCQRSVPIVVLGRRNTRQSFHC